MRPPAAAALDATLRPFGGFFVKLRVVVQAPVHLDTAPSQPAVRWHEVREIAAAVISIHGATLDGEPNLEREVPVPSGLMFPRPSLEERREAALKTVETYLSNDPTAKRSGE